MSELKIIVCLRQVPDPDGPRSAFVIDDEGKRVTVMGIPPVINPFDENALEAALQLKETHGAKITALCVGEKLAKPVMIKAVAVGAEDLILLQDPSLYGVDSATTALVLSRAVQKIGDFDLILTGMISSDWGFGQAGILLAERLGIPCIAMAHAVEIEYDHVRVKRAAQGGHEVVKAGMPAVVTTDSLVGDLRYPSLKSIVMARKQPVDTWSLNDLDVSSESDEVKRLVYDISPPPLMTRECDIVDGETPEEMGRGLARALVEKGIVRGT